MQQAREEEPISLNVLFKEHYAKLCHFSFQLTGNQSASEDIVQEAFIKFWAQRDKIAGTPAMVRNYLYTIVRNGSLNSVRHDKVVQQYLSQQDPLAVEEDITRKLIRSEVLGKIYAAIAGLPPACSEIFRLGYLEGLKNQEIADHLGLSINTIKTQKKRALQLLRMHFAMLLLLILHS